MIPRRARAACLLSLLFGSACESPREPTASNRAASSSAHAPADTSSAKTDPSATPRPPVAADGCTGLGLHACAKTKGCLLDQPTYQKPACRPAENACEAAVRHADLIGSAADPAVTDKEMKAAAEACAATSGCAVTEGRCSCPCYLLGSCDCTCGGSYLPRCALKADAVVYNGRPPAEGGAGPLGALGNALVSVKRAPSGKRFVVDPMPPVEALVGERKHQIEIALGTAMPCVQPFSAPCQNDKQAFYSFYKLDKGARGGGPELRLTYDDKDVCTNAAIVHSR